MAAARRILFLLSSRSPSKIVNKEISGRFLPSNPLQKEISDRFLLPSMSPLFRGRKIPQRGLGTLTGPVTTSTEGSSLSASSDNPEVKISAMSNLKVSSRHDLAMVFTCKVCETRSVKTTCRESYEKGVVVVRCGGCNNLHLIADRLGWFGEPSSVEDFLTAQGEEFKKGSVDTLNLTLEELAGSGTKP